MATHKSAEKRSKQAVKHQERNTAIKSKVKTNVKTVLSAVEGKDQAGAVKFPGESHPGNCQGSGERDSSQEKRLPQNFATDQKGKRPDPEGLV